MMNKFLATGRLGGDPEVRYSQDGNGVARFSLAVDRMDKEHTTGFINCVAFGKIAEFAEKYLRKGTKVEFVGHVSPGSYKNKDGVTVYTYDFIAESLSFAESKASQGGNAASAAPAKASEPVDDDGFMNIPDDIGDELPFE